LGDLTLNSKKVSFKSTRSNGICIDDRKYEILTFPVPFMAGFVIIILNASFAALLVEYASANGARSNMWRLAVNTAEPSAVVAR
jgi:hypothetical protein